MQNNLNINISSGYDLDDTKATRITELKMTCLNLFIYFRLKEIDHHFFWKIIISRFFIRSYCYGLRLLVLKRKKYIRDRP